MTEYESGFTIHGFNWMCTGTLPEKITWTISIIVFLSLATYMIYGYIRRYLDFEYRTEIRYEEKQEISLPTIVFCSGEILTQAYCYKDKLQGNGRPCHLNNTVHSSLTYRVNRTWLTGQYIGNNCHVINVNESMKLVGKQLSLHVRFDSDLKRDSLNIFPLSYDDYQSRLIKVLYTRTNVITLSNKGKYNVYFSQRHISRLPNPYSPNCSEKYVTPNTFSTRYSQAACYQQCVMDSMLKECGDLTNFYKMHLYDYSLPLTNRSDKDRRQCFRKFSLPKMEYCHCPLQCAEIEYNTNTVKVGDVKLWNLYIYNADVKLTHIQQVPDYTLEDLLGAVGGILGLAIGTSCLSVLELCVYFVMVVLKKMY